MKTWKKFVEGIKKAIEADIPTGEVKKVIEDFQKMKKESWVKLKTNAERITFIVYIIISVLIFLFGG